MREMLQTEKHVCRCSRFCIASGKNIGPANWHQLPRALLFPSSSSACTCSILLVHPGACGVTGDSREMLLTYFLTLLSYFTFLVLSTPNFSPSTAFFVMKRKFPAPVPSILTKCLFDIITSCQSLPQFSTKHISLFINLQFQFPRARTNDVLTQLHSTLDN